MLLTTHETSFEPLSDHETAKKKKNVQQPDLNRRYTILYCLSYVRFCSATYMLTKAVDVLGEVSEKFPAALQRLDESVCWRRHVIPRIQGL